MCLSLWFQVTIVSRTLILDLPFPGFRFVLLFSPNPKLAQECPEMLCILCAHTCLWVWASHTHICAVYITHGFVSITFFLTQPLLRCTVHITKLSLIRKLIWKGDEALGWGVGFYSHILLLIRKTLPSNPLLSLWRMKGLWDARVENLAVIVLGLCLPTQVVLNVTKRLWKWTFLDVCQHVY